MSFNEGIGFFITELDVLHDYVIIVLVMISYLLAVVLYRLFASKLF